jgi:hypothetical protein
VADQTQCGAVKRFLIISRGRLVDIQSLRK